MKLEDHELLRRYARERCEEAFAELVRRHADLVWGAGWRTTGDADLAKDIAQRVFSDLAAKARFIPAQASVAGWLYRAAMLAAKKATRTNARRARREAEAMKMHLSTEENDEAEDLIPFLDEALRHLGEKDRTVVVLRFFARKSLAEIGRELAISEDAAQKRVARAVERLRGYFAGQGRAVSSAGLSAGLTAASAMAAPAGLAGGIAAAASQTAAASGLSWAFLESAGEELFFMKAKIVVAGLSVLAVGTPLAVQQRTLNALERERAVVSAAMRPPDVQSTEQRQLALEWARHAEDRAELEKLRVEAQRLRAQAISPELQRELDEARAVLRAAEAAAKLASDTQQAINLREETMENMKWLGLAARIYATDNQARLPTDFEQMAAEMENGPAEKRKLPLHRFEFVRHEREVTEMEPELLLIREKEARKYPNGKWVKAYTFVDGSVHQIESDTGDFSEWESQRIGRKEPQ